MSIKTNSILGAGFLKKTKNGSCVQKQHSIYNSKNIDRTDVFVRQVESSVCFGKREKQNILDKYVPSGQSLDKSHLTFYLRRKNYNPNNRMKHPSDGSFWSYYLTQKTKHYPWKMHLYADSETDWQKMYDVLVPYFVDNDVAFKTLSPYVPVEFLNINEMQKGKTFTVYSSSAKEFKKIAKDVDYIFRNNGMVIGNSKINGDRQLGKTGRIFYRYEYSSRKYKDIILDLKEPSDNELYDLIYEGNRSGVQYMASDMTCKDDPWYRFNPEK